MAGTKTVSISLSEHVAEELPPDPAEREQIVRLGLKEWRVRRALDDYRNGQGSLAHAASAAGVSLREMIPLAYAHGLSPRVDSHWIDAPLSPDIASTL